MLAHLVHCNVHGAQSLHTESQTRIDATHCHFSSVDVLMLAVAATLMHNAAKLEGCEAANSQKGSCMAWNPFVGSGLYVQTSASAHQKRHMFSVRALVCMLTHARL